MVNFKPFLYILYEVLKIQDTYTIRFTIIVGELGTRIKEVDKIIQLERVVKIEKARLNL